MGVLGAMMDWIEWSVEMTGYESDQEKIFNRSVKELILKRSKFQSANSVHTYEQRENGIGKNTRQKISVHGKHLILRMLKLQK